jgi:hypothetical protein
MTDEQALVLYAAMEEEFGVLPDFEHHPIQFAYYVKLFKLIKSRDYFSDQTLKK